MANIEGSLAEMTIESEYLKDRISLSIYLPANYTPLKSYHLMICQDGQDFFRLGRIHRHVDTLISEMDIEEVIVVGVPYPSISMRRTWYHPDNETHIAYTRFLACELLPKIEESYSVEPLAAARILAGDSLAATISLLTALEYPTLFKNLVLFSPYVNKTVQEKVSQFSKTEALSIYHIIGTKEDVVKMTDGDTADFLKPNRELSERFRAKPFHYTYREFEGDHTWTHWQKHLSPSLKTLLPL
ncbi:alpha/beta hydrolase [Shouchella sp. JSM 1781072]|uniref:alpha/beta hydrolase n=1 Tax=Bacillaceae TaxID=186817 RepID=UPI000C087A65|nr:MULTISPECIES: alpha/beta hydrolase-fold protein [Bacillaceae]UTR08003.1 alpha/beta hydrolase-fold protein [Alkalihalobacillus sp. LMS6]